MKTEYADALNRMIAMTPNSNLMIAIPTSSVIRNVKYADSEVGNVLVRGTVSDYIITSTFDFKEGRFFNDLESRMAPTFAWSAMMWPMRSVSESDRQIGSN
jgi:putative ABC transport system permease protein